MSKLLEQFIAEEYRSRTAPDFRVGDTVRVHQIVLEVKVEQKLSKTAKAIKKTKEEKTDKTQRVQVFEGVVIAKKHGREPGATFTVRKIASGGVGVEKIYPLYSPLIAKIEVVSRPKRVRRAKLYFLRGRVGKAARRLGVGAAVEQEVTSVEAAPITSVDEGVAGESEADKKEESNQK